MRKLSPRALAIAAGHTRATATLGLAVSVAAAASLWLVGVGSAANTNTRISVRSVVTKGLTRNERRSPPGDNITFTQNATLTCAPQPNGQPSTCTAIAALVGDEGPLDNIPLATYARVFTSDQSPITLTFGLSQNTLNLLYKHRGDPRCTVTVAIVNDSSTAGTTGTGSQSAPPASPGTGSTTTTTSAPGVGTQSSAPARSFTAYINVPPAP